MTSAPPISRPTTSSNEPTGTLDTSARQRQTGIYGEGMWTPTKWTIAAGGRIDHFSNFDANQWTSPPLAFNTLPNISETVFDPRLGIDRRLTSNFALTASAFRAYRAPTQNELYRTGQVGQELTKPNPNLRSERATGWETGVVLMTRYNTYLRASYFWTPGQPPDHRPHREHYPDADHRGPREPRPDRESRSLPGR